MKLAAIAVLAIFLAVGVCKAMDDPTEIEYRLRRNLKKKKKKKTKKRVSFREEQVDQFGVGPAINPAQNIALASQTNVPLGDEGADAIASGKSSKSKYYECDEEEEEQQDQQLLDAQLRNVELLSMSIPLTRINTNAPIASSGKSGKSGKSAKSSKCTARSSETKSVSGTPATPDAGPSLFVEAISTSPPTSLVTSRPTKKKKTKQKKKKKKKRTRRLDGKFLDSSDEDSNRDSGELLESTTPKVCIVVTAFNVVDYIQQAIDSLLGQTHQNIHIVIVDDGSTDGTPDYVMTLYKNQTGFGSSSKSLGQPAISLVRLPHNTLGGTGQPSNVGIGTCNKFSTYLMFQDGDDFMEPDAVASMVESAQTLDVDIVIADFDLVVPAPNGTLVATPSYDQEKWKNIPAEVPLDTIEFTEALGISPVPWRKLYRLELIQEYNLRFLEGDFFYEDNAFHWTTMIHAESVSKIERVFFHHRRERKGQTSSNFHLRGTESGGNINTMETIKKVSAAAKLGGMLPNLFQMGNDTISRGMSLPSNVSAADLFAVQQSTRAYFAKVKATSWIGKRQLSAQMQQKFARHLAQISNHWFENANPSTLSMVDSAIREFDSSAENVDLSIIIPTYNVGIRVLEVLYSLYAQLPDSQFSFEVLVVDDGSSDDITARLLLEFASQQKPNFYLLSTASTLGAGRARNMAIPLVEGRYVYFADADDGFNFEALKEAVKYAASNNIDLLVLPYFVEQVHSESPPTRMIGMMPSDERIWKRIRESGNNLTQTEKRDAALALINYPWKQLTRSDLMFNAHVYFGPTVVHNDVQFHWTSIAASRNTSFYFGEEICVHRKFDPTVRGQLTQVSGKKRMEAFAAIHLSQRALTLEGAFDAESDGRDAEAMVEMDIDNSEVLALWKNFTKALLSWGSNKVPAELLPELTSKRKVLLDGLAMLGSIPEEDPLPYWRTEIVTGNANHGHTNSIAFV